MLEDIMEELQNLLTYPSSYRATDVRRRILDEAKEEINNLPNSDIQFDYELLKTGKSFTHVRFHVYDIYDTAKIEQNDLSNQKEIIASKRINQKITSTIQVVSKRNFYLKRETLLRL